MPSLSDVTLQSMQRADVGGKKAVHFTIVANVRTAEGTADEGQVDSEGRRGPWLAAVAASCSSAGSGSSRRSTRRPPSSTPDRRGEGPSSVLNADATSLPGAPRPARRAACSRGRCRGASRCPRSCGSSRAARQAGVRLDSLTPQAAFRRPATRRCRWTSRHRPLLRLAVPEAPAPQPGVSGSRAHASGRLFSVDSVSLAAGESSCRCSRRRSSSTSSRTAVRPAAAPTATPTAEADSASVTASAAGGTP